MTTEDDADPADPDSEIPPEAAVADHYDRPGLTERLLAALEAAGADPDDLEREDLLGIAEFHVQGWRATAALADLLDPDADDRVLDVAAGLGGPARTLAAEYDCRMTAVDLTPSYCRAGAELTRRVGLDDHVDYCNANALALPVRADAVDAVWCQHLLPNVPDTRALVAEFARVLVPGGRLAVHEVFAGDREPRYPLPFAVDPSTSFVISPDRFRSILAGEADGGENARFRSIEWHDVTAETVDWYRDLFDRLESRSDDADPGPGLDLVVGDRFPAMTRSMYENLDDGRLAVYRGTFELVE